MEPNQNNQIFSVVKEDDNGKLQNGNIPNINDKTRVFTIGIYGGQKLGKSSILNILYGTDFKVGESLDVRTTEGINGRFVKNNESFNTEDTIVLDCEGEKSQQKKIAIREQVFALPKLTDQEKEDKAESILKVSDIRYATFLWCASNCIMVILPNTPPNNDTVRFFELIHQSTKKIEKTGHQPSLILIFRTNKSRLRDLIPAYKKVFDDLKGFSTLISDLKMLHLPEYDDTPEEPAFQNALTVIKEEINTQSIQHEKFIQASWAECLKRTASNLNNDANLEDLNLLKVQIELNFVLSQNPEKILEVSGYLENMESSREIVNNDFDHGLFEEYQIKVNSRAEAIAKNTNDYKFWKTMKSSEVAACAFLATVWAPFAIVGVGVGVVGLLMDSEYNKTIETLTHNFHSEHNRATEKLRKIQDAINQYKENFDKAALALGVHETIVSRIEFFYAIARRVLKKKNPEATPEECLRYLFILFNRNLNVDHNQASHIQFIGNQNLCGEKASNKVSNSVIMGSNLSILARGGCKFLVKESGEVFGSLGKTVLRTVKYGGATLAGVVEVFDLVSTWRTDQSKLIDDMKESKGKLGDFYEKLKQFWKANAELLKRVDEVTKGLEESGL